MERTNAMTILNILNSQWCSTSNICTIASCGKSKGLSIMKQLKQQAEELGYWLPNNLVPTELVIDFFKINVDYLKKISDIEAGGHREETSLQKETEI